MPQSEEVPASAASILLIHLRWSVADAGTAPLNEEMLIRLRSYLPRYAETLSARCLMVGGVHDHVHLLLDLPVARSLGEVEEELRRASQRFLRDVLGSTLFVWGADLTHRSISPLEQDAVVIYIQTQAACHDAGELWDVLEAMPRSPLTQAQTKETVHGADETLPDWLRSAMSGQTK